MSFQPPPGGAPQPPPGQPYPPPQGYGPPPQQGWPQQPWSPGPPPKKRGNGWKWGLGAVALLAVVGVTAAVTISVTKDNSSTPTSPSGNDFGLASANDKGPANIITEDPSCAAWRPISDTFADIQKKGWNKRDPAIPATAWTPEQRAQYEEVGRAARNAADQTVQLAKLTPHRVMREVFEQFVAYARAYSDAIPTYKPSDDNLAGVVTSTGTALGDICSAIDWHSAEARSPLISAPAPPSDFAALTDPNDPKRFLTTADPTCPEWVRLIDRFDVDTKAWQDLNPNIRASDWSTEQRVVIDAVLPVMKQYADSVEKLGRSSANPVIQDLAVASAQYRRAYSAGLPTYTSADYYLAEAAVRTTSTIYAACKAVAE